MKKKWKFGLKVADSHSEPGNLQKLEEIFIFLIMFLSFFHFPCPWHLKSRKTMKINGKPSKTKENEKKWSCKWKKNENLDSKLQILTLNQEIFKNSGKFSFFFYHFFIIYFSFFYHFPCPWHLKFRKTMKINEKQWKTIKNKGKWKKMKLQMKKNENLDSKLQILTPNQEIFKNSRKFSFFLWFFFFIFLARGTWNPAKPWKSMKNNGKPSKTKENEKKWSCKWKKWKFGLKVADSHSEPGNLQKRGNFHFFIIFFHFPCRWHLKSRKSMKINGNEKNEVANEKKKKIWIQSCRFSLWTRKSSKIPGFFHVFIIFLSFSLPVAPEIQENHENQWKTMENNQKQRNMKKNEIANEKKNENLDSKLQILTLNQEIFKNSGKFSFFLSFYYHLFFIFLSFSLPVAPEIQENHENQWKTMENNQKQRKMNNKWDCKWKKCKFGLKVADSHSEPGNLQKLEDIFIFLNIFYHFFNQFLFIFLARGTWNPGKPWKLMENHQKQRNMKKNEVANEKNENLDSKLQIPTLNQEIFKNSGKFSFFLSFFYHFPCPWHLKSRKTMKINEKQWKPGDSIVALFSGKPLVGYTFCHPWTFFEGLRTFWGFQWIWALFWVQTHFTPLDLLNSWRNPRS